MSNKNSCITIFRTHEEAEQAIAELNHAGIDMKKLSIVGKGYEREEHVMGYYNALDRVKFWGKRGAFWGGLWGVLFSPAVMYIPVAGSLTVGRILLSTFISGLSTAIFTGSLSAFGAALYSIGIPRNSIIKYETAIKLEKYLLVFHGTSDEVKHASDILGTLKEAEVAIYGA
ncbi:MAG: permease [Gammaproteobacteria bacterium]|nr:MAG: permease [Gammaproteobacteria bacterium]